jgi:hypothetical protein
MRMAANSAPESRSGALSVSEAARTFDSRLKTHHKSRIDWVLWNIRSATGSERSNCMWWQDDVILEQFPALSMPKACPDPRR